VLKDLGVPENDGRRGGSGEEADPADEVLAKVEDSLAAGSGDDVEHGETFRPTNRWGFGGDEPGLR
jgi:hypothetical protein